MSLSLSLYFSFAFVSFIMTGGRANVVEIPPVPAVIDLYHGCARCTTLMTRTIMLGHGP
jgi:hypothetical protein